MGFAGIGSRAGVPVVLALAGAVARWRLVELPRGDFYDLSVLLDAAPQLRGGEPLYDPAAARAEPYARVYNKVPLVAVLLLPFTLVPRVLAVGLRTVLSRGCNAGALWLLLRHLGAPLGSGLGAALALLFAVFQPTADAFAGGQLDPVLLALLVGCLAARRSRREGLAASLLALAATIKILPALLAVDLLVRRDRVRLLALAVAAAALLPAALAGASPAAHLAWQTAILPNHAAGTPWLENQSLGGFFLRLWLANAGQSVPQTHPAPLVPEARALTLATSALVVLATAAAAWRGAHRAAPPDGSLALWLAASLIVAPVAWERYAVVLLIPLALLIQPAWLRIERRGRPAAGDWLLLATTLGLAFGNHLLWLDPIYSEGPWRLARSIKLYAELALWAQLLLVVWRGEALPARAVRATAAPGGVERLPEHGAAAGPTRRRAIVWVPRCRTAW